MPGEDSLDCPESAPVESERRSTNPPDEDSTAFDRRNRSVSCCRGSVYFDHQVQEFCPLPLPLLEPPPGAPGAPGVQRRADHCSQNGTTDPSAPAYRRTS